MAVFWAPSQQTRIQDNRLRRLIRWSKREKSSQRGITYRHREKTSRKEVFCPVLGAEVHWACKTKTSNQETIETNSSTCSNDKTRDRLAFKSHRDKIKSSTCKEERSERGSCQHRGNQRSDTRRKSISTRRCSRSSSRYTHSKTSKLRRLRRNKISITLSNWGRAVNWREQTTLWEKKLKWTQRYDRK